LSFPIGTWALWLRTTLDVQLAESPSLAKTAEDGTFLLWGRAADEQFVVHDIALPSRRQPADGLKKALMPKWLSMIMNE